MINIKDFNILKQKYQKTSSWAVWEEEGNTAKSNVGNMDILNPEINKKLLDTLNPNIIMVGLNLSGWSDDAPAFSNFHSSSSTAQDYKIRYAFKNTIYWGAYMTDVIKGHVEVDSTKLLKHLRNNPENITQHIESFQEELSDLKNQNPIILAFGVVTHSLLKHYLPQNCYSQLISITHYSHYISKEKYRETVHRQIAEAHQ